MNNFWQDIEKPIFTLAPMEDVTDTVFREILLGVSDPQYLSVVFAEFTSTDGLCHEVGKDKVSHRLFVNKSERKLLRAKGVKLAAQIWGGDPEKYYCATRMLMDEYDFDGIDINMGCPVKKIVKQAACSELIRFPELAKEIVLATKEASDVPVSVKTRTGIDEHITYQWTETLMETEPAALILHGRTQKMMSKKPADWEEIHKAVEVRDAHGSNIPVIGNGDIFTMEDALEKIEKYGVDGVMIGRGVFTDPWIFKSEKYNPTPEKKLNLLLKHVDLFVNTWGEEKNFNIMKKFFKIYTLNIPGASELRGKLMDTKSVDEVKEIVRNYISNIAEKESVTV